MAIVRNGTYGGGYNDPSIAAAAQNLAAALGPPRAADLAAYSTARANNQKADIIARLSGDPEYQGFDYQAILADLYDPTQSFRRVEMDDATTRRGQDISAQTSMANARLAAQANLAASQLESLRPGDVRPGMPEQISDHFGLPPGVFPEQRGLPQMPTVSQWTAGQLQQGVDSGQLTTQQIIDDHLGGDSASQQRIARLAENLMATGDVLDPTEARNIAVGIVDGRLRADRDPITGATQILDMGTGMPYGRSRDPLVDLVMAPDAPDAGQYGEPYPNSEGSFGAAGALAGVLNTGLDVVGVGAPFQDVQQTQAAFGVLRESLLNDIASAYDRQPPSWLLQEIRNLTPTAGSPFEGSGGAQAKLTAIGRHLTAELDIAQQSLQRPLSPANRQAAEARVSGLQAGLVRVQTALDSFPGQAATATPVDEDVPEGIDLLDWRYLTPEERELFR